MEALLSCGRNSLSTVNGVLFCTTFPCHNCAKHIIAAGIRRVVYIEPYEKSKAKELFGEAIAIGLNDEGQSTPETLHPNKRLGVVRFEPFVGVGPRRFFDLFSMRLGSGYSLVRKNSKGNKVTWQPENARARMQMLPLSYLELEFRAATSFRKLKEEYASKKNGGRNEHIKP
jgi:hypothetical protein